MKLADLLRRPVDVVLFVAAIFFTGWVMVDRGSVSTEEAESRKQQVFDAWRANEVRRIDLTTPERHVVLTGLEDADGELSWSLSEDGLQVEADDQAVGQYLVSLEFASWERKVDGSSPAELGLAAPAAVIAVDMGKLHYVLRLGGEAPSPPGARYLAVEGGGRGQATYVITKELAAELVPEAGELRSRSLVPYLSVELRAFVLVHDGERLAMERGGWGGRTAGQFALTEPKAALPAGLDKVRIDRRAFDGWLGVLARLRAERFLPAPPEAPAGAAVLELQPLESGKPAARIELGGAGKPCDDGEALVVRRAPDPTAGCVPAETVQQLLVTPADMIDQHVLGTAEGDVVELRLTAGSKKVELARLEAGWHMRAPVDGPTDAESANALLEQMAKAEGEIVSGSDAAAVGLVEPVAEVTVTGLPERVTTGAGDRIERLLVGTAADGFVHVRRLDDGAVLRLGAEVAQAFVPRAGALRSTLVNDIAIEAVRGLVLDCRGKHQRLERSAAGAWTLVEPSGTGLGADLSLSSDFTEKVRQLRALRWVTDAADPAQRLAEPWCRIELQAVEGGETKSHVLELGADAEGGFYARAAGEPAVFVAPRAIGAQASDWFVDRMALLVDADHIAAVRIAGKGDARLELARVGERLLVKKNPADPRGDVVEDTLSSLTAEAVVALGEPAAEAGFAKPILRIEVDREGEAKPLVLLVGRGDAYRDTSIFFVRRTDIEATFAVAQSRLRPLLDAL
jgi:uncharacterized protein DUF4340